ncbi:MAG: ribulose-phosphate 3-epimerase [Patescibacteria group bacterium UBA2103]
MLVTPAILPKSFAELSEKITQIRPFVKNVQLDVCDGKYVDTMTWPYTEAGPSVEEMKRRGEVLPEADTIHYGVDLMVSNPDEVIGDFIALGATRVIIHFKSTKDFKKTIDRITRDFGYDKEFAPDLLSVGMAVPIDLPLTEFAPYVQHVDFIQFMGIVDIGRQGQGFDPRVVAKIKDFHKRYPDVTIQVDGGISLETAPALLGAGADRLAVGSALFKTPNIGHTIKEFEKLSEQYGIYE